MYKIFDDRPFYKQIENLKYIPTKIKFNHQRRKRGWCDYDTWDIDEWFMEVFPQMLQHFKDNRHGSPGILISDFTNDEIKNLGIDIETIKDNSTEDNFHILWDKILERMIFLLHEMNEDTCSMKNPYVFDYTWDFKKDENYENTKVLNINYPTEEDKSNHEKYSDFNMKIDEYRMKCKDEFMDYFKKYFFNLWD